MRILTEADFIKHPELNCQNARVGMEVEDGILRVNSPDYDAWKKEAKAAGANGGGNPPPPIPFP